VIGDHIELYPAHGARSLCGRALSSKLSSTIGTERKYNGALLLHSEALFIENFLQGMPEAPDHFSRCSSINRQRATALADLPKPTGISPTAVLGLLETHTIVDTRDQLAFSAAHLPGAYGLDLTPDSRVSGTNFISLMPFTHRPLMSEHVILSG